MENLSENLMTKSTLKIYKDGTLVWHNDKWQHHREDDKPAVIFSNGYKEWRVNGALIKDSDD